MLGGLSVRPITFVEPFTKSKETERSNGQETGTFSGNVRSEEEESKGKVLVDMGKEMDMDMEDGSGRGNPPDAPRFDLTWDAKT